MTAGRSLEAAGRRYQKHEVQIWRRGVARSPVMCSFEASDMVCDPRSQSDRNQAGGCIRLFPCFPCTGGSCRRPSRCGDLGCARRPAVDPRCPREQRSHSPRSNSLQWWPLGLAHLNCRSHASSSCLPAENTFERTGPISKGGVFQPVRGAVTRPPGIPRRVQGISVFQATAAPVGTSPVIA